MEPDAHDCADDVEKRRVLRHDVEDEQRTEGIERSEEEHRRLPSEAIGEETQKDTAEPPDAIDRAEELPRLRRTEPLVRHEEIRSHRRKSPVRDDVQNLNQHRKPDHFIEADGAHRLDQMKLLDILGRVRILCLEPHDEQEAENNRHSPHVLKSDAPLACRLKAPPVVGRADICADRVKRHHKAVEHCTRRGEDRAGHRVHDNVPTALCDTEHKAPKRRADEVR